MNILVRRQIVKFVPGVGALFLSRPPTPAGFSLYDSSCVVEIFYPGVPVTNISPRHRGTQLPTLRETIHLAKVAVDAFINVCCFLNFLRMCQFLHLLFFSLVACLRFFFSIFVFTLSCGIRFHQSISCHFSKYCLWRNPKSAAQFYISGRFPCSTVISSSKILSHRLNLYVLHDCRNKHIIYLYKINRFFFIIERDRSLCGRNWSLCKI
jgi:hypothetical protein